VNLGGSLAEAVVEEQPALEDEKESGQEPQDQFIEYEHVYKIIMIGSSAAGKTSLIYRFTNDTFNPVYLNTVGVDLKSVTLQIYDTLARINIWDTTGQEKFKALTKGYFRNCQGAVAVFDLTKRDSFY
jgi:small GTP-binding protein